MPIDFPNSPSVNDSYSAAGKTWVYDGTTWNLKTTVVGNGSISTAELADNAVTSAKIAANTIATGDIADGAITTEKIAANAVVEADILNGAVTSAKLASNAVVNHLGYTPANAATVATTGKSIAMAIVFGG